MARTNIELDDDKVSWVMKTYSLRTKRDAVDFALTRLMREHEPRDILELTGIGWDGDLDELRS
jgi:Arc/MetJ family transcription regulator